VNTEQITTLLVARSGAWSGSLRGGRELCKVSDAKAFRPQCTDDCLFQSMASRQQAHWSNWRTPPIGSAGARILTHGPATLCANSR